ncbi:hypothetical protein [Treponema brennaborense]|uniref:Uncharacterized protein n=1 Tax=Treponema brennaborense (strain DSM 12168 / CIP 105900 / DD5/3) TaxID=906968 RepID=F4LMW8_TREBD|nr:hypothetical protein [Treponema brennaborense]AEE17858.1 hypothetical protein Trebr_2451 [Treponema brennaborense DSM 12168]
MIWLRKRQDDQLIYAEQNSGDYIKNEMLSFSDYKQSIEESILDDNLENDIKWKSFQLVDVYLRCMIVYKWIVIPTIKGKIAFFKAFASPKKLKEYVSIDCLIPSEKILSLPHNIQENFQTIFNEVMNDFVKEYKYVVKIFKRNVLFHKTESLLYANTSISFLLYGGLWSALRVLPKAKNSLGELIADTKPMNVIDFIDTPICHINEFEQIENEIKDKPEFFKLTVIQSIDYFITLQKLYFVKLTKEEYLKLKCYFFEDCEFDIKKQFLDLLQDSNFVAIKNNCPEFQDYCYILLKTRILKYENNILQATKKDSWGVYYPGSFIHDKNLELVKHFNQINTYFMELFGLKKNKDLNDKESYSVTYNGYKNLSNNTIIPKLNELKISRK